MVANTIFALSLAGIIAYRYRGYLKAFFNVNIKGKMLNKSDK